MKNVKEKLLSFGLSEHQISDVISLFCEMDSRELYDLGNHNMHFPCGDPCDIITVGDYYKLDDNFFLEEYVKNNILCYKVIGDKLKFALAVSNHFNGNMSSKEILNIVNKYW